MEQQFLKTTTGANLNLFKIVPKITPRGIIQITHGMVEHGERYQRFAESCASEGFAVFIHDYEQSMPGLLMNSNSQKSEYFYQYS